MAIPHSLEQVTLTNNVQGLLIDAPNTEVTAYTYGVRAGSDKLTRAYPFQVAHTLEHVIESGPDIPEFPKKSIYLQEIQKNGALRNAATNLYGVRYYGDAVNDEALRILQLRTRALEVPRFNESILASETGNVVEEMRQRVADYGRLATALSRIAITDGNWQTSHQAIEEAKQVSLDDIKNYYNATHTLDNLRFIVAGDMDTLRTPILDLFSTIDLPTGKQLNGPEVSPARVNSYSYEERSSLENVFTNMTMAIPRPLTSKESATMEVIDYLLTNAWDSRILGKAREAGLCYSMFCATEQTKTLTVWGFDTPVGTENASAFFNLMTTALTDVAQNGVTDEEIHNAVAMIGGRLKKNGQTTQALHDIYAYDYFGLGITTTVDEQLGHLNSVTSKEISAIVSEFLSSGTRAFSGVGSMKEADFAKLHDEIERQLN